ncbi:MAG: hypothetical protein UX85_C0008G0018 [Candidatus Beckwithbacteria bacterium GW2011_GWB1_47_15]|uniref:Integral membrane protein n=1 Tax=Candidatus Beckwithbacteria bacterium GW2011_GWB1_47_15 TaxID=1618371 RepID=A0A0G1RTM9_9BACT|nr:MAG: protein of unknown function with transmembrane region [Candidatus Beckwithbacteria bacterium GW2011_GWC1_49_16]KKU34841.1 MAG: hypothetical protein UX50_C0010G0010 [Candidatus Beckwithbacteria bacterium GW2011_GWA1_46_30]KKU60644.1 MAG: hypothetical protein UX85_C0008G0018 [Candidatus Beckwithbacteria bacterium GW2011_GWB1_47_15]KKU72677.1 MAG: hypothetical protein UX97_C0001G0547 [Candidatus Beckwithbacteria bacterium GW2011_GWA2_47_25]KKW02879.1 MAG: hypothetical protein UY37_C0010G00
MDPKLLADSAQTLGQIQGFLSGFSAAPGANPENRFTAIISNIITVFTIFGGLAFLTWFVIGAVTWVTSSGNPEQLDKAKKQISTAIAGLAVLVAAYAITFILSAVTGLDIINLERLINSLKPE